MQKNYEKVNKRTVLNQREKIDNFKTIKRRAWSLYDTNSLRSTCGCCFHVTRISQYECDEFYSSYQQTYKLNPLTNNIQRTSIYTKWNLWFPKNITRGWGLTFSNNCKFFSSPNSFSFYDHLTIVIKRSYRFESF